MSRDGPLGPAEAAARLAPLTGARGIVLAVSGGPDSVALMGLAAEIRDRLPPLLVATVDHGLQPGSADIAGDVTARAAALGLDAALLRWDGEKPASGLQAAARTARYRLLTGLAVARGASHVVTAHTLDDQAETILFRLMRGSGPAGLAGMRALEHDAEKSARVFGRHHALSERDLVARDGVALCRPLLGVPKARLIATCRAAGWRFTEDPANADPRFARARLRALMPRLAAEGLDAAAFARLGARLARDEAALRAAAARLSADSLVEAAPGRLCFAASSLLNAPAALLVRVLEAALDGFAHAGPPRLHRLEALAEALAEAFRRAAPARRTLHGARVSLDADGLLRVEREGPRRRGTGPPSGASDA